MKAIVDCNSFYCSCERVFLPHLDKRPVVVLSNNDGCIVSRSDEAKELGIGMAVPYFMAKKVIQENGVSTFSSNYNLYGDLSWRVMETLRIMFGIRNVEVYSVDEAFLNLDVLDEKDLFKAGLKIRKTIEQWTGIKVSVGIAPTKVLCKVANHLAKKNKEASQYVVALDTPQKIMDALQKTPVESIWGVGRQNAAKLKYGLNIHTAFELSRLSFEFGKKFLGGVVGIRLIKELRGEPAIDMEDELVDKKMIATTRMFGNPVKNIADIKEAVATYTTRAAEKLRRQHGAARVISVFVVTKEQDHMLNFKKNGTISTYVKLPNATSFTNELITPAVQLVDELYEEGQLYKKAGVMLSGIVSDKSIQGDLFLPETKNCSRRLMDIIDNINFSQRNDLLKFAASGTDRDWKMRMEMRSPRYTTRWDELYKIR